MGAHAFQDCGNLSSVTLSENINVINDYTFPECTKLQNISIPVSTKKDEMGDDIYIVNIEDEDVDTIGGFVVKQLGRLAEKNDVVVYENLEFVVKEISKTRITKLRVNVIPPAVVEDTQEEE